MPARKATQTASLAVALSTQGGVPEWIKLIPAGVVRTKDGRGPYKLADPAAVIAASLQNGERLPIDENHATDLAAPKGGPSPARGWIVALEARADGLWGKVEWTKDGTELLTDRAYRHISPVFCHRKDGGEIRQLLRASLCNTPNLRDLVALNTEGTDMDLMQKLRELLGLPEEATEDDIVKAVAAALKAVQDAGNSDTEAAVQSALKPIAVAVGLTSTDATAVLGAVETLAAKAKGAGGESETVTALQAELAATTKRLNDTIEERAKDKATEFVDGAIQNGVVGVKPCRDHYIARHMKDPEAVEKEINALPRVDKDTGTLPTPPVDQGDGVSLNAEQRATCALLGIAPKDYQATLAAERAA